MQPYLHTTVTCVAAPATWLSGPSGQIRSGADGLYVADRRILSRLLVTADGEPPAPLAGGSTSAPSARFTGVLRALGDGGPDPTVTCVRDRTVDPGGGTETITIVNRARQPVTLALAVEAATDLAAMGTVKAGDATELLEPEVDPAGRIRWRASDGATATLVADPPPDAAGGAVLTWHLSVPPRGSRQVTLRATRSDFLVRATHREPSTLQVTADDRRLDALVAASVRDLDALRLDDDGDPYYAAGSPWYLTLFGRDALWAARLALPLGTDIAAGTLRALARRQGARHDELTEEQPGKILHETRPPDAATSLPPVYYGSVDSTALFVSTVAEAYRWGMAAADVAPMMSNVERALAWLAGHRGFVAYRAAEHGLANQGWKDSHDGVQFADGRLARTPIALSEVQAYAYRAAMDAAWLLDAFDRPDGDRWRAWAKALAERFRAAYWCDGAHGPYPAIALDAAGRPVDGPASNMGHLLGTGLLDAAERARVAGWLSTVELASPYGLRTLATTATGYNPLSYHAGSVWPHDTAIAILGLVRDGHRDVAARYIEALLAAAARFDYRLPELYGGDEHATPYPPACRPQAWTAAVGPALVTALLGLSADVPGGTLVLRPIVPSPVGALAVRGLRIGAGVLDVSVDREGRVTVGRAPSGLRVDVGR